VNLFLLEDDYLLNKAITQYFRSKGFQVSSFHSGADALSAIGDNFSLIILDIDIPDINGLTVLEEIRALHHTKPIIMISATIDIDMISKAYEKGCNDYMKKPFDIRELEFKIHALVQPSLETIRINDHLEYRSTDQQLFHNGQEVVLTPKEKKLLHSLIENKGRCLTIEQLERIIWGSNGEAVHLRQLIARLRKKLPNNTIENRNGSGYCIV
jgi:DNA-binding response OmpR family regulator